MADSIIAQIMDRPTEYLVRTFIAAADSYLRQVVGVRAGDESSDTTQRRQAAAGAYELARTELLAKLIQRKNRKEA